MKAKNTMIPSLDLSKVKKDSQLSPPKPSIIKESPNEYIIEEYLSERKLREATGEENLEEVQYLELIVNTTTSTFGKLGSKLPNLKQLKLNGSTIPSIRDLGTSMRSLEVLWISRCGLREIDGISVFSKLKELYLSYNELDDLSAISDLEDSLEVLDVEGNNIVSIDQLYFLRDCTKLYALNCSNNKLSLQDRNVYVEEVQKILPNVRILDEFPIDHVHNMPKKPLISKREEEKYQIEMKQLQDEIKLLNSSIKYGKVFAEEDAEDLKDNPMIICKAPKFVSCEEKDQYITKRPRTARGGSYNPQRFEIDFKDDFNARPSTARPHSKLFDYSNSFRKQYQKSDDRNFSRSYRKIRNDAKNQNGRKKSKKEDGEEQGEKTVFTTVPTNDQDILKLIRKNKMEKQRQEVDMYERNLEKLSQSVNQFQIDENKLKKSLRKHKRKLKKKILGDKEKKKRKRKKKKKKKGLAPIKPRSKRMLKEFP